jgi:hypothetical protein
MKLKEEPLEVIFGKENVNTIEKISVSRFDTHISKK